MREVNKTKTRSFYMHSNSAVCSSPGAPTYIKMIEPVKYADFEYEITFSKELSGEDSWFQNYVFNEEEILWYVFLKPFNYKTSKKKKKPSIIVPVIITGISSDDENEVSFTFRSNIKLTQNDILDISIDKLESEINNSNPVMNALISGGTAYIEFHLYLEGKASYLFRTASRVYKFFEVQHEIKSYKDKEITIYGEEINLSSSINEVLLWVRNKYLDLSHKNCVQTISYMLTDLEHHGKKMGSKPFFFPDPFLAQYAAQYFLPFSLPLWFFFTVNLGILTPNGLFRQMQHVDGLLVQNNRYSANGNPLLFNAEDKEVEVVLELESKVMHEESPLLGNEH